MIQQFAKSVSYPTGPVAAAGRTLGQAAAGRVDLRPYLAGTFAGAFYAPVSTPADREVTPAGALGLSIDFTAYNAGGSPPVYTALSVAAAADVIDGLTGQALIRLLLLVRWTAGGATSGPTSRAARRRWSTLPSASAAISTRG